MGFFLEQLNHLNEIFCCCDCVNQINHSYPKMASGSNGMEVDPPVITATQSDAEAAAAAALGLNPPPLKRSNSAPMLVSTAAATTPSTPSPSPVQATCPQLR